MIEICKYIKETEEAFMFDGKICGVSVKLALYKNGGEILIARESAEKLAAMKEKGELSL